MKKCAFIIYLLGICLVAGVMTQIGSATASERLSSEKKAAIILPFQGYSKGQYTALKKAFEQAGITITVVSTKIGKVRITPSDPGLQTERTISQLKASDFDAVIFIGAMCNAPAILADAGVLKGRKVTSMAVTDIIHKGGGDVIFRNMTIDGNFITATVLVLEEFAKALV